MTGETGMGLDEAEEDNATSATSADLRQWESLDVAHQQNKASSQLLVLSVRMIYILTLCYIYIKHTETCIFFSTDNP
jgi:hypothetical protein